MYLMFKAGSNDTMLTHFNKHYKEERSFRVFEPENMQTLMESKGMEVLQMEKALDNNWIPYCCLIMKKK